MDGFNLASGRFLVWRNPLIPTDDGGIIEVPLAAIVDRFVQETKNQKYGARLLEQWQTERAAVGVTLPFMDVKASAW